MAEFPIWGCKHSDSACAQCRKIDSRLVNGRADCLVILRQTLLEGCTATVKSPPNVQKMTQKKGGISAFLARLPMTLPPPKRSRSAVARRQSTLMWEVPVYGSKRQLHAHFKNAPFVWASLAYRSLGWPIVAWAACCNSRNDRLWSVYAFANSAPSRRIWTE
jgi:hypothetical protein